MAWVTQTWYETQTEWVATPGWDAGARSIETLSADGGYSWRCDQVIGAVVGLNDSDLSTAYQEIKHGFYIESSKARVIESGSFKTSLQPFSIDATFKVERLRGTVRYYVNDSLVYTSLIPSEGVVFLDSSLYSNQDAICSAEIFDYTLTPGGLTEAAIELHPLQTSAWDTDNVGMVLLHPLEGEGAETFLVVMEAELHPLTMQGSAEDINSASILLHPLEVSGITSDDVIIPEFNAAFISLAPLDASGYTEERPGETLEIALSPLSAIGFDGEFWDLYSGDFSIGYLSLHPLEAELVGSDSRYLLIRYSSWGMSIQLVPPAEGYHTTSYKLLVTGIHNTNYQSEINLTTAAHETSWRQSALAVHNTLYALLDAATSTAAFSINETSWASVGSSVDSAFTTHDAGWSSIGAGQSSANNVHHTSWDSFIQIPGYAVHEVSWASSGGTAMVLAVHESGWSSIGSSSASAFTVHEASWNSIGAGSLTSVFTVHDSGWGTGITPYAIHTSTYQSVVESLAVHHAGWNSFVVPDNFAVHDARYRSYSLDPQFILANAYIEPDIALVAASVTADEDSPYYQCEVELRDPKLYGDFPRDLPFILRLFADEYHFVVDSRNLSRTIDDDGNYQETVTVSGLSPLCLKAAPRSTPVTKTWITPTYASAIVEELIGSVTWNLVDWIIPSYRLAAESADPFEIAQQVVTAAGGLIESQPDGSVVVRHRWPTSIASLDSAILAGTLYETTIHTAQEQPTQDVLMNRIRILDSDAGFQDRLEYVPNKLDDGESDDPWNGILYAYPSPWRDQLRIVTTRGSKIQIGAQSESVLVVKDHDDPEDGTAETITFESGKSSARYPIMALDSFEWLDENLGGLTFSPYATTLEASATGTYYGYSLAKIAYTSRRLQVPVACSPSTSEIEAQFLLLENQS
jgi:hypothetical protein